MHALGELSHCLTDADPEVRRRDRKLRGFGVAASIVLETVLVVALVIGTLANAEILPRLLAVTPVPFAPPRPAARAVQAVRTVPAVHLNQLGAARAPVFGHRHELDWGTNAVADPTVAAGPAPDVLSSLILGGPGNGPARPPEPPRHQGPLSASSGVMEAMLIDRVQPVYPAVARVARISGKVELRAIIGTDGTVRSLQLISGQPLLVGAALNAVRQWRYRPTLLDGIPVEVETFITVDFLLQ